MCECNCAEKYITRDELVEIMARNNVEQRRRVEDDAAHVVASRKAIKFLDRVTSEGLNYHNDMKADAK